MRVCTTDGENELRRSRARMVAASHAARRRIERRLHDGPQQHLVAMAVKLLLAEQAVDADPEEAKRTLAELRNEMQAAVQQLRDVAHAIYPPLLADRGLGEALGAAAARSRDDVEMTVAGDGNRRYPEDLEAAVYFSCLEAIEGAAGPLSIWVGEREGTLELELRGVVPREVVTSITDRTDTLGGTVSAAPEAHGDIGLRASLPLR